MSDLWSEDLNISYFTMIVIFLITIGLFYPLIKRTENTFKRAFFILLLISYYIYSGLGISVLDEKGLYFFYYLVYTIVLVFSLYIFRNKVVNVSLTDDEISDFIEKHKLNIIYSYLFLQFILLIFPENKLALLISPPTVDLSNVMDLVVGEEKVDKFTSIITVILNIILPFYFMTLLKYKDRVIMLFFLIVTPVYLIFCRDSYISRTLIVLSTLLYILILYYYHVNWRRKIIIFSTVLLFFSVFFLAAFVSIRNGEAIGNISFTESIKSLFVIECTFPKLFEDIYLNSLNGITHGFDYIIWLVTQPIPGFLKSSFVDFQLNQSISKLLLGVDKNDSVSFILLTGLVSESVFVFGRFFFVLHAFILGYTLNLFINLLSSRSNFYVLLIYSLVFTGLAIGRSGTSATGVYPFMIKTIVYVPVIFYLYKLIKPRI